MDKKGYVSICEFAVSLGMTSSDVKKLCKNIK